MKIRKIAAAALAAVLLAGFVGCTQPAANSAASGSAVAGGVGQTALDPKKPVTLTLWHYYIGENQQALGEAVSRFNQTVGIENGVVVTPAAKGSIAELEEAVTNSAMGVINADPMPDIFSSYPDKALEIDALGKACDLNQYFTDEEKALYVESFLQDGIFSGGRMLLVPMVKSTELLYVNATAFEEFAAETDATLETMASWEGVYETARAYYQWMDAKTPDIAWDGKGLMGFDSVANYIIIGNKQMGVDVIDGEGGQAVLREETLRRLFDIYFKGYSLGYFNAVGKFRSDDIKAGELVAYVGSSSGAAYFPTWIDRGNTEFPISFTPMTYPTFEGGKPYAIQQGAGMCVAKSDPQKEEGAALFLKWLTAPEENIGFAMTTGYLPVQQASYESQQFNDALMEMRQGDEAKMNVAGVYEIALQQITQADTYAAKPFEGSYEVRSILQSTLMDAAVAGREAADALKAQGLSEDEVLAELDADAAFAGWLQEVQTALDGKGVAHSS